MLKDETEARLFLRYQSEARSTFHRAYAALVKAIDRRQEEDDGSVEDDPRNEADRPQESPSSPIDAMICGESPDAASASPSNPVAGPVAHASEASEAVSRNEANPAGESSQVAGASGTSDATGGTFRARRGRPEVGGDGSRGVEDLFATEETPDRGCDFVPIPIVGPLS